jgi:formiminotetrahydrofolate cyclodeaminase
MRTGEPSECSERGPADPYLTDSVEGFLDQLADRTPAPGGGAAAALTCAMAASLVEMAASFAPGSGGERAGARARELRHEAAALAHADGRAYGAVLEALRLPKGEERSRRLDESLSEAIAVPMRVLDAAAEVATLAAELAETGNRNLEGDALTGALLAEAAARSAGTLARLNLSLLSKHVLADAHLERLRPALSTATRARERAVGAFHRA